MLIFFAKGGIRACFYDRVRGTARGALQFLDQRKQVHFSRNTKSRFAPVVHDSSVLVSPKSVPNLPNLTVALNLFNSTSNILGK